MCPLHKTEMGKYFLLSSRLLIRRMIHHKGDFFCKLREAIGPIENLVFISDWHNSIQKKINSIFLEVTHRLYTYHISENLKAKYTIRQQKINTFIGAYFKAVYVY